jgi:hypothetical protein
MTRPAAALIFCLLALTGCAGKPKPPTPKEPGPPEPVAVLHSLRWEISPDARSATLHATGVVPSAGYQQVMLAPRPKAQPDVREYDFAARPPGEQPPGATSRPTAVEAFLTFSLRAVSRMTAVRVFAGDAVLELPLTPVTNPRPPAADEVRARLALLGPTPAAYVGKAVYTPGGFRAFSAMVLRPGSFRAKLRAVAYPTHDARAVAAFDFGRLEVPVTYAAATGDSFDVGELNRAGNWLRLRLALTRRSDRTVASVTEPGVPTESGTVLPPGPELTQYLLDRINNRPAAVEIVIGEGVVFDDLITAGKACRAAGASYVTCK